MGASLACFKVQVEAPVMGTDEAGCKGGDNRVGQGADNTRQVPGDSVRSLGFILSIFGKL